MMKFWTSITAAVVALIMVFTSAAYAEEGKSFSDVGDTYWAKEEIDSLASLGLISGYQDGTFKPNKAVTREEFAALITRAFYLELPAAGSAQSFIDVSSTRWSFTAIEASKEFLTGYYPPSGRAFFDPTGKATREDVAIALVKTMGFEADDLQNDYVLDRFYDADEISPNVRTYIALAVENKLIGGYNDGTFRPEQAVTRSEAAALLFRVIKGAAGDSQQTLTLNVDAPATVSTPTFYISGDVTKGAKVFINNKEAEVVQGQFRVGIQLDAEGTYTYTVSARQAGGKTQSVTKMVKYEKGAPMLDVKGVPATTDKAVITVTWTVKDENDPWPIVYLNGERVSGTSANITLEEGENLIAVTAENNAGKTVEVVKQVVFLSGGPELNVINIPAATDKETLTVTWTVKDKNDPYPKVFLNGKQVSGGSETVTLKEGENALVFKAVNSSGKSTEVTRTVTMSSGAPLLTVDPLPQTTDKNSITVAWRVSDKNDPYPKVYLNGSQVSGSSDTVSLSPGENSIVVRAVNKLGKITEVTKTVTFTSSGPTLTVGQVPATSTKSTVAVTWTVSDKNDMYPKVFINDQQVFGSSDTISLSPGQNTIRFKAVNNLGQSVEQTRTLTFEPPAPILTLGYAPETTSSQRISLSWSVSDTNDMYPKVYLNDQLVYGSNQEVTLTPGANAFKLVASNSYGKTSVLEFTVTYAAAP